MSGMDDERAAVLDGLRKAIVEHETRLAKGRRQSRQSDADARQTQALLKITLNSLKHTLQQIEKSHEVVATSHTLLKEIEENERRRADQAGHTVAIVPIRSRDGSTREQRAPFAEAHGDRSTPIDSVPLPQHRQP